MTTFLEMDESSRIRSKMAQRLVQQQQILTPQQRAIIKGNLNLYTAGSANYADNVISYNGIPLTVISILVPATSQLSGFRISLLVLPILVYFRLVISVQDPALLRARLLYPKN